MTKFRVKYLLLFVLCVSVFSLTACKKEAPVSENNKSATVTQAPDTTKEEQNTEKDNTQSPATAVPEQKEEGTPVDIYGINEDSLESEPAHATIKGLVTAEAIVQAVVDDYKKHSIEIGIYSVTQEDKKVIVSFEYNTAPIANVGTDVEETILNCISDSLMDNLDSCEKVTFRAEDGAYESGHFAFGLDEVYASK